MAEGGYDPVVDAMFSTEVDGWFMEVDNARADGFEPLRKLPAGKKVVLGLVTTGRKKGFESPILPAPQASYRA